MDCQITFHSPEASFNHDLDPFYSSFPDLSTHNSVPPSPHCTLPIPSPLEYDAVPDHNGYPMQRQRPFPSCSCSPIFSSPPNRFPPPPPLMTQLPTFHTDQHMQGIDDQGMMWSPNHLLPTSSTPNPMPHSNRSKNKTALYTELLLD